MALLARIEQDTVESSGEERGRERFRLRLSSPGQAEADAAGVTIHELSASGFLIESDAPLATGSELTFMLPAAGNVAGTIVWSSGAYHGGQFRTPLSRGALSAALAASRIVWPNFSPTSVSDRATGAPPPSARDEAAGLEITAPKLPLSTRLQVIAGASILLWSLIGVSTWLVAQAVR